MSLPDPATPLPTLRRSRALLGGIALYLLLTAIAMATARVAFAAAAVFALIVALLVPGLRRGMLAAWLGVLAAALVLAGLIRVGAGWLALDLVPMLVNAALCVLFARTLMRGRVALIARFIAILEGEQRLRDARVARYARGLTLAWALVLGVQAGLLGLIVMLMPHGVLAVLGVGGPRLAAAGWIAYLHAGSYLLVAVFMLLEYAFRRWHLRHIAHLRLPDFLLAVVQRWPALLHSLADDLRAGRR